MLGLRSMDLASLVRREELGVVVGLELGTVDGGGAGVDREESQVSITDQDCV